MNVDLSRCRIVHPGGQVLNGRFIFQNGKAAVWTEERLRGTRKATRHLYATDATYEKAPTARVPNKVLLSDGTEWLITQQHGGCNCNSPLKGYAPDQLLEPDLTEVTR